MKRTQLIRAANVVFRLVVILELLGAPPVSWAQEQLQFAEITQQAPDMSALQRLSEPNSTDDAPVRYLRDPRGVHIGTVRLDDPHVRVEAREARSWSGATGGYQVVANQAQMAGAVLAINADYSAGQDNDMLLPDGTCKIKAWNPSGSSHACSEGLFYVNGSNRSNWTENPTGYRSAIGFDQNSRVWIGLAANIPDQYRYNAVSGGPWWLHDGNWRWNLSVTGNPCTQVEFSGPPKEVFGCSAQNWNNARPLSTAGISEDGKTLILAASTSSLTPDQMRDVLKSYGVHNAIRFDSGGSASFFCTSAVSGCPSGVLAYGSRPLPNSLVVKLVDAPSPCPAPSLREPNSGFISGSRTITFRWNDVSCNHNGFTFRVKTTSDMDRDGNTVIDAGESGTNRTVTFDSRWEG